MHSMPLGDKVDKVIVGWKSVARQRLGLPDRAFLSTLPHRGVPLYGKWGQGLPEKVFIDSSSTFQ